MAQLERINLLNGKVRIFKRSDSQYWHCLAFLYGEQYRQSTEETNAILAKEFAEYWYMELCVNLRRQRLVNRVFPHLEMKSELLNKESSALIRTQERRNGKQFKEAAKKFLDEYEVITEGQRNAHYAKSHEKKVRLYLVPFFGEKYLREIDESTIQDYRAYRKQCLRYGKAPSPNTIRAEITTLRMVFKTAKRCKWIEHVPDLAPAFKGLSKISHRGWFSEAEYKMLYTFTRQQIKDPKRVRWREADLDLHDYILFMANTGLRPDEASTIQYRDVEIVYDESTNERILIIEVRGKRGVGYCKSMNRAIVPFLRLKKRHNPDPTDLVFPNGKARAELLNTVLRKLNLKFDRDGNPRAAYSLRHTYICFRLMQGADIYQIAKNCRTSVKMIQNHYAVHLKNTLDASAINVRKYRSKGKNIRKSLLGKDSE